MRYVALFITVPLTVFAVLFGMSNTAGVTVSLWPLFENESVPGYLPGLGLLAVGFFSGALFVFLHSQHVRLRLWQETRRADRLEKDINALKEKGEISAHATAPTAGNAAQPMLLP